MPVYSIYIFDRHTECIYHKRWPLPGADPESENKAARPQTTQVTKANDEAKPSARSQSSKRSDEAKLVFGVIFSLRNMVRRLGGEDDEYTSIRDTILCSNTTKMLFRFISCRTGEYKLHYYETPTSMKFIMLTDTKTSNLRVVLHQIWANLYVEYVTRNPLSPIEHPKGVGVNNELFEMGLDRFVVRISWTNTP